MRIWIVPLLIVLAMAEIDAHAQGSTVPVWIPQAPPFGTIATLSQLPELRSVWATAGPAVTDIRVAEWSPLRHSPGRFLRLLHVEGTVKPTLILWWFGSLGRAEICDPVANDLRERFDAMTASALAR